MAGKFGVIGVTAPTWIHGCNKLKISWVSNMRFSTDNLYLTGFNRLAQGIEGLTREFGQFIKKQDTIMRERNLTRLGLTPTPNERRHTRRMMRCTKWPVARHIHATPTGGQALNHRNFQALL
jgi:hypothetical protein